MKVLDWYINLYDIGNKIVVKDPYPIGIEKKVRTSL
jgi:hypothetical protein